MTSITRNVRTLLGLGILAVAAAHPSAVFGDNAIPVPPKPLAKPAPAPAVPGEQPDATGSASKIDAMDTPKAYLKKSNVGTVLPLRDGPFGTQSHFGRGDDGGQGHPHYDHPNYRYDIWYRPHAFGYGKAERCAPSPFRPRGYGDLFSEPSTCYRMDYSRHTLKNYGTDYGPSYYRRQPNPFCDDYDHSGKYRPGCDRCRLQPSCSCERRKTKVWTFNGHNKNE